jgi:hypothetical protein
MNDSQGSFELTEMYRSIWLDFFRQNATDNYEISARFYPYTTLKNTIRKRGNTILVRVSDLLMDAPEEVIRALGVLMFSRMERRKVPEHEWRLYKDYVNSRDIRQRLRKLRQIRGKKVISGSEGKYYNLNESFDRVNLNYFNGELKPPILSWNKKKTRLRFGHHDEAHNTIVISRTLDDGKLPRYLLDYVMYHEILHIKHGITYKNGRRSVHSKAFIADEKKFLEHEKAKTLLKKLSKR